MEFPEAKGDQWIVFLNRADRYVAIHASGDRGVRLRRSTPVLLPEGQAIVRQLKERYELSFRRELLSTEVVPEECGLCGILHSTRVERYRDSQNAPSSKDTILAEQLTTIETWLAANQRILFDTPESPVVVDTRPVEFPERAYDWATGKTRPRPERTVETRAVQGSEFTSRITR